MDPVKNIESNLRYWPASVFISLFHFIWSTLLMPSGRWVYIRLLDVSSVWENSLQTLRDGCDIVTIPVDQQFMKSSDRLDWYQQPQHIQSHVSPFLCESSSPRLHGVHWVAAMWLLSYLFVLTSSWTFYPIKTKIPVSVYWLIRFPLKVFIWSHDHRRPVEEMNCPGFHWHLYDVCTELLFQVSISTGSVAQFLYGFMIEGCTNNLTELRGEIEPLITWHRQKRSAWFAYQLCFLH